MFLWRYRRLATKHAVSSSATAVGLVAVALALGACGSSSKTSSASTGGGAASSSSASTSSSGKVGYVSVEPVTSGDWETSNWHGLTLASKKYHFGVVHQENVSYDQAPAVLRRLAPQVPIIILDSSGYEAPVLQVAPQFPHTMFVVVSDLSTTEGLKNVAGFAVNWDELGYLGGVAGCLAAKAKGGNAMGHVNSLDIPAFERFAGGEKAAAAANGCRWMTRWTNSVTDTAAAQQAALSMIAQGAQVITSNADTADAGSLAGAQAQHKLYIAEDAPANQQNPKTTMTSLVINFDRIYDEIGRLYTSHQLQPKIYPVNVENSGLVYELPFQNVPSSVQSAALGIFGKIKSGQLKVDPTLRVKP